MEDDHNGAQPPAPTLDALCAEHRERPAVGTCQRCGDFYCDACAGRREGAVHLCRRCDESRAYVPWEDPTLGFWARYLRTLRNSVVELPKFAVELPTRGGWLRPLAFAMLPTLVSVLIVAGAIAVVVAFMGDDLMPNDAKQQMTVSLTGVVLGVAYIGFGLGGFLAYLVLWAAVLWGTARLLGNRRLRYEGLCRVLCYASGFNFLYFFPVLGLVVLAYHVVVAVSCIAAQGRTSALTALGIFGLPVLAFGGFAVAAYVAVLLLSLG